MLARLLLAAALLSAVPAALGQERPFVLVPPGLSVDSVATLAATVTPSARQRAWQARERIAFLHFGMNTFTGREWGTGAEDPALFQPTAFDARQWIATLKEAGFTTAILTAKHHDGFCLWPTATTDHSVRRSPWKGGGGDVVRAVADACRAEGIGFGFYLSPWDRHAPVYGRGAAYDAYFRSQLTELLTGYGPVAEVWFDGANGEGPEGRRQVYDWPSYYALIRALQPGAAIVGMGPDARWVGNESGTGRDEEWSVVPVTVSALPGGLGGDHPLDAVFCPGDMTADDLGSRDRITGARVIAWYPAETDVSIRPGWFYHAGEDARVKPPSELAAIYERSVGRNGVLLLNVPPDRRGLIAEPDRRSLLGMRRLLDETYGVNLLDSARVTVASDGWTAAFPRPCRSDRLVLAEEIGTGQRIEGFRFEAWKDGAWATVASGATVGAKRIVTFPELVAERFRFVVTRSRGPFRLAVSGLHRTPPAATIAPDGAVFVDSLTVTLSSPRPGAVVRYTLDGGVPDGRSPVATGPLTLHASAAVAAVAVDEHGVRGEPRTALFRRSTVGVMLTLPPDAPYTAFGAASLADSLEGSPDHADGRWLGFEGNDCEATLDLGAATAVRGVRAGFLDARPSWIFPPDSVTVSVSLDARSFARLGRAVAADTAGRRTFALGAGPVRARYVRVHAYSPRVCPPGHPGAGKKCWIFVDEISILTR